MFVEYDTERGMMRWCESEEEVEVESGRSVRSHELVRSERVGGTQGNMAEEARRETVSPL
jgi:hypothetical protein